MKALLDKKISSLNFTEKQIKVFEKNIAIAETRARVRTLQSQNATIFRAFNSEIFSLKIELDVYDEYGNCELITIKNHKPFSDISKEIPDVNQLEIKEYLQIVFEKNQLEILSLETKLNDLEK